MQRTQIFVERELDEKKGAAHRNILSVTVHCTFVNANIIFSTLIRLLHFVRNDSYKGILEKEGVCFGGKIRQTNPLLLKIQQTSS